MAISVDYISISNFTINVDGAKLDEAIQDNIIELVADSNMHLPSMLTIKVYSENFTVVDSDTFKIGKAINVSVLDSSLFKGEITGLEPEFGERGTIVLLVRAYDKSHRLHRGKKIRNFANVTDAGIVSKVASEAGLSGSCDFTSVTYDHVWQDNQTDWEFLRARAERLGCQLYFDADTSQVCFKKYATVGAPVDLEWGENLRSFRPRHAATHQVKTVNSRAWDPKKKEPIADNASSASDTAHQGGESQSGGQVADAAFGSGTSNIVHHSAVDAGHAKSQAQALLDELSGEFVQAEGACIGNPKVKARGVVNILNAGTRFGGQYVVSSALHVFDLTHGYETSFSVNGRQPDTIMHLVRGRVDDSSWNIPGVVPAIVTNNNDPDGGGRVKVKYPWLSNDLETFWARLSAPGAGATRGFYSIPEIDDEVLVAFEHGDVNRPYIVGGLWNGKDAPPKKTDAVVASGKVNERIIRSRTGHVIILVDKEGEEQIVVRDKTEKNEIVINSVDNSISVKAEADITIEGKGNITVKSTQKDLSLEANNVTVKARKNLAMEATQNCDIKATQNCTIKATINATVEGTAGATVKNGAGAQVALSGPSVSLNNGALDVT